MEIKLRVPEGKQGDWMVQKMVITPTDSKFTMIQASKYGRGFIPPGEYLRLAWMGEVIMSNTPDEIWDHRVFIHNAKKMGGDILINGLGLGMCIEAILECESITSITVIEKSPDVIALTGPTYSQDPRVKIINADALEYIPEKGKRFSCVWHDIWPDICADNLEEMAKLHRKYGRRCEWQGSWCRRECEAHREQERRYERERNRWYW